ncbi:MAG: SH3 domain-containing protein, partial [Desulfococcaceae bacterium]
VGLSEAMARTVRHRLSLRKARMARVLADSALGAARYHRLPEAARNAGYGEYRGVEIDPTADSPDGQPDLAELWDVLDLGLSRFAYASDGRPDEARLGEKALQNLLNDVRHAFYRAAAAQALTREAETVLRRADAVIREQSAESGDPAAQHSLYERMRHLQRATQELAPARAELGLLMNLPPDGVFTLETPPRKRDELSPVPDDASGLDAVALRFRKEVDDRLHLERRLRDARAALARMGAGRSDPAAVRNWRGVGTQLAVHLFGPAENGGAETRVLDMGIVTQVELAMARYRRAERAYRDAVEREEAARLSARTAGDALAAAGNSIDMQLARVDRYLAFAESQNALARVYNAVGVDPLPEQADVMEISELAQALERSMARWGETLASALAAYGPDRRRPSSSMATAPGPGIASPLPEAEPAPRAELPPLSERVPAAGEPARAPPSRDRIRSASESGRKVAREISVFRDVVSIRRDPASNAPVIGQGLIGERYPLLGWAPDGWLKIEMNDGSAGWIPTRFVRPVTPEKADASPADSASGPDPMTVITTTRANVRFGAGLNFQIRYTEEAGVRVPVVDATGDWFKVRTPDGELGWLHESVVRVAGSGG